MIDPQILDQSTLWAMQRDALTALSQSLEGRTLDEIKSVRRTAAEEHADLRAAFAMMDDLEGSFTASLMGSTAVIPIMGTIRPRPSFSLLEMLYGGTSTNLMTLQHDLDVAMAAPQVESVVFYIDSPGGLVGGVSDAADAIYEQRGVKPMTAFVAHMGASAAYWLASAADTIVASRTAELGSIGVQALGIDMSKLQERVGIKEITITSSQSPLKNIDPQSEKGRALIQQRVDDAAAVFVEKVARNRGVEADEVLEKFGQGDVLIAERAVAAGMADKIGSFEALIATATREGFQMQKAAEQERTVVITKASIEKEYPELAEAFRAEGRKTGLEEGLKTGAAQGAKGERERIQAIQSMRVEGLEKFVDEAAFDATQTPEKVSMEIVKRIREGKLDQSVLLDKDAPAALAHDRADKSKPADKPTELTASLPHDQKEFDAQMVTAMAKVKEDRKAASSR